MAETTWLGEPVDHFCPVCNMRLVGDRGETHPCPMGPHEAPAAEPTYGYCTACYAVETKLNKATGTKDLSAIGESPVYPTGYGCELCA